MPCAGDLMARFVEDADGLGVLMIAGDNLLHAITGTPDIAVEILLQGRGATLLKSAIGSTLLRGRWLSCPST
jgi:hypothetical protein